MSGKTCFVISPIGEDGSDIRKEADALLWIIRNALSRYGFQVQRVDEIPRPTEITSEIVQLIQSATLCVIVLTSQNPNVFYEAGRRHESGKPFLQLVRKDEPLPFDVAGIKTIIYSDVETREGAARTMAEIQRFVDEFEKSGYGPSGTGVSLATIATAIDRLERRIGQLQGQGIAGLSTSGSPGSFQSMMVNPREAFMTAIAQGDLNAAVVHLRRLEQLGVPPSELLQYSSFLATAGSEPAAELIFKLLNDDATLTRDDETLRIVLGSLVSFYGIRDQEVQGVERLKDLFERALAKPELSNESKAFLLNQQERLFYGAGDYERAQALVEEAIRLNPNEVSYFYNASMVYNKLGLARKTLETVDHFLGMGTEDPDHLGYAVTIYAEKGRPEDAKRTFARLRSVSPSKAAVVLLDPDVQKALSAS